MNVKEKETKKVAADSTVLRPLKKNSTNLLNNVDATKRTKKSTAVKPTQLEEVEEQQELPSLQSSDDQNYEASLDNNDTEISLNDDKNNSEEGGEWTEDEEEVDEPFDYEEIKKNLLSVYVQLEGSRLSETMVKVNNECDDYLDALYYFSDNAENISEMEWLRFKTKLSRFTDRLKNVLSEMDTYEKYVAQARELGLVEDEA